VWGDTCNYWSQWLPLLLNPHHPSPLCSTPTVTSSAPPATRPPHPSATTSSSLNPPPPSPPIAGQPVDPLEWLLYTRPPLRDPHRPWNTPFLLCRQCLGEGGCNRLRGGGGVQQSRPMRGPMGVHGERSSRPP
jgi:hypothetical protein